MARNEVPLYAGVHRYHGGCRDANRSRRERGAKRLHPIGATNTKETDTRFADRYARVAHRAELRTLLEEALQAKSAAEWEELFTKAGVPAGPILNVPEIIRHPQIESRELIKRFANAPGVGRDVEVSRVGFRLGKEQPDVDRPPPTLGRDTDEILKGAGYSAEDIEEFRKSKVI